MKTSHFIVKLYLFLGSIFDVLIGIGCMIVASEVNSLNNKLLVVDVVKNIQHVVVIVIYILGAVTIVTGIFGFFGILKRIRILRILFIILNILYFIIFGAIFAANVYGRKYIDDNLPAGDCATGPLKSANDLFKNAKQLWCRTTTVSGVTVGCQCTIPDQSKWSATQQLQLATYLNKSPTAGTKTIQTCPDFLNYFGNSKASEMDLLGVVESYFGCTGICEGDIINYFSDVAAGPPSTTVGCYPQIRQKIQDWLDLLYIYCLIAAIICLINVIAGNFYIQTMILLGFSFIMFKHKCVLQNNRFVFCFFPKAIIHGCFKEEKIEPKTQSGPNEKEIDVEKNKLI